MSDVGGHRPVPFVDVHNLRRVLVQLGFVIVGVADDDHSVPGLDQTSGRSVETNVSGSAGDGVGD